VRRWEDGLVGSSGSVMMLWKGHWADWRRQWSAVDERVRESLTLWWWWWLVKVK
jgi:hypothetical protein